MAMDPSSFESINPSHYTTFTFPHLHSLLHVAVLDSSTTTTTTVAAMVVPPNRQSDWTFSTLSGHLQLLLTFPNLSRLILISNLPIHPNPTSYEIARGDSVTETDPFQIEASLMPLVIALAPRSAFSRDGHVPEVPFLTYEDDVVKSDVLEICEGCFVGEMLVEDVLLRFSDGEEDFRRRLRFKRMPNLVQTQMRICPNSGMGFEFQGEGEQFCVDDGVLVQPYLAPMVAGIMVIGKWLDGRISEGLRPKALCLGVGGGALLRFLSKRMGFQVFGVEEDEIVLQVGKKYFGLESSESVHLCVANGIETIEKLACRDSDLNREVSSTYCDENRWSLNILDSKFDVIMVDMDSSDAKLGTCAPPLEFIRKSVLMSAKTILCEFGALIINVIPPTRSFYEMLIKELMEVFAELYEIDVGNEENFVVIASVSAVIASSDCADAFTNKLRDSISQCYIDSIKKIPKSVN